VYPLFLISILSVDITPQSPSVSPFRQPQIAARASFIGVTFGSANTIYFAASRNFGDSFQYPVEVSSKAGALSLGRHRGPRIAITLKAIVISAIAGPQGRGRDGDILAWRSLDNGKTWSDPSHVNAVPGSAREGLHAMAASPDGHLYIAWLDLRSKGTKLYGASSRDDGKSWSTNELLYSSPDGHICECCHPSVAINEKGEPFVMFRNWFAGNRDMYLIAVKDRKVSKLGNGSWPINACPMDGGGVSIDEGKIYSAWRRDANVFWNELGKAEIDLGKGKDPAIVATPKGPVVVWNAPEGLRTKSRILDPGGSYSALATSGVSVYATWETGKGIRVERLN
jgi:hypothetical protein